MSRGKQLWMRGPSRLCDGSGSLPVGHQHLSGICPPPHPEFCSPMPLLGGVTFQPFPTHKIGSIHAILKQADYAYT